MMEKDTIGSFATWKRNGGYTSRGGRAMSSYTLNFNLADEDLELMKTVKEHLPPSLQTTVAHDLSLPELAVSLMTFGLHYMISYIESKETGGEA